MPKFLSKIDHQGQLAQDVATPVAGTDVANKAYVDSVAGSGVALPFDSSGFRIINVGTPTDGDDAATKAYVDAAQPTLDDDLIDIAALAPADDTVIQRKAGEWVASTPATLKTDLGLSKSDVGLGNVDNTSDVNKPISTATQTALNGKQPLDGDLTTFAALAPANDTIVQRKGGAWVASTPATVKTDLALTKTDVGLGNVDNTSDVNKPVSTAQAAADATKQPLDSDLTAIAALAPANDTVIQRKAGAWVASTPATVKTDLSLTKSDVGLGNVDNTSDANKPVSTAQQTALDGKQPLDSDLTTIAALAPANDTVIQRKAGAWVASTPATVKTDLALTKSDVGLGNVDNTSDVNKPVSTAQQAALDLKAPLASPALTGVPTGPTATVGTDTTQLATTAYVMAATSGGGSSQPLDSDLTDIAALAPANDTVIQRKAGAWVASTPATVKTDLVLVKADVGLGNVDNTSDANKPISTATQAALDQRAPLVSPALVGTPTAPTASPGTSNTQVATTAFVVALDAARALAGTNDSMLSLMRVY